MTGNPRDKCRLNVTIRHIRNFPVFLFSGFVLFSSSITAADADEDGDDVLIIQEVEVEEKAPEADEKPERFNLTPAVIKKIDEEPGVNVTTEEILESTPSVRIKKFGSFGSPSLLSIRGSDATHTLVLLDDIPLNDAASGLVDLSTLPSFLLESVSVFRGFTASAPSPFHPGGTVKFVSKRPGPGVHGEVNLKLGVFPLRGNGAAGAGAGQKIKPASSIFRFGAFRQLLLSSSVFNGKVGYLLTGSMQQSEGDFVYYNDNGTVYNPGDDFFLVRNNNHHASVGALLTVLYLPDMWSEVKLSFLEFDRVGGVPGLDVIQAEETRLHNGRQYLGLVYNRFEEYCDFPSFSAKAYLKNSLIQWVDPLGEVSNARQDSRSRSLGSGMGLQGFKQMNPFSTLIWGAGAGFERWDGESRYAKGEGSEQDALRLSAGWNFTCFVTALEKMVELQGSLRFDVIGDRALGGSEQDVNSSNEYFLSPGAGIAVSPFRWISLSLNVSRSHRPATLVELFGNQGFIVGNADLNPEKAVACDVGAVFDLAPFIPVDKFEIEYHYFNNRISNLITFIQNSQKTMVAQNIGSADLSGFELSLAAAFAGMVSLRLGYTFLDPRDRSGIEPYDGRMLPNRPRHDLFFDAGVSRWGVTLSYKLDLLAGGYIDRASLRPISERVLHSVSIEWEPGFLKGFYMGLELWNLGNFVMVERKVSSGDRQYTIREAASDVDGYPLPGLGVYFSAGVKL